MIHAAFQIARREVFSFFVSPLAYVVLTVWLLLHGLSFYVLATFFSTQDMATGATDTPLALFFGGSTLFYIPIFVVVPLLTMRLVAEEQRSGTLETLLTAPVTDAAVALGKYAAGMTFWVALWAPTTLYVWIASRYGDIDLGVVASSYLGVFALGAYYVGVGLFMSTIAKSQLVAAILTFLVIVALFTLGIAGEYVFGDGRLHFVSCFGAWRPMQDFGRGIVDSRYLVFDASAALTFVFLSVRALEARRYA